MIILSAGHNPNASGAVFAFRVEHDLAVLWVNTLATILRQSLELQIVPTGTLEAKTTWINRVNPKPLFAVELHLNSDPSHSGHGSESLYCPGSARGKIIAEAIESQFAKVTTSRGVKEGWYRMDKPGHIDFQGDVDGDEKVDYFLKAISAPAVIVEPAFIHEDLVLTEPGKLVNALAAGIVDAYHLLRPE